MRPGNAHGRGLGRVHERLTRQTIADHVAAHGWVCPGWRVPPHPVPDGGLQGEHILPRSTHPHLANDPDNYSVLCPTCNKRKGSSVLP